MSFAVEPIELCLESMDQDPDDQPYVRCVAISGAESGLGITAQGDVVWQKDEAASALLWVSADNQLILVRHRETESVRLVRSERVLDLPLEKPVVVLDEDLVFVGERSFCIHVHGVAQAVHPPERLSIRRMQSMIVGAAIAAASMAGCRTGAEGTPITSTTSATSSLALSTGGASSVAPVVATGGVSVAPDATEAQGGADSAQTTRATAAAKHAPPIEVRHHPPKPVMPRPPSTANKHDDPLAQ